MKKLTFLFFFLFSVSFLSAQDSGSSSATDAGSLLLTGSSSLNIGFSDGTPIILGLGASYFIIDNLAAGVNFGYISFDGNSDTSFELTSRYYITNNLFGGANLLLDDETVLSLSAGYDIFLNDKVALEPVFNYPFNDFLDPSISVGFSIFLN